MSRKKERTFYDTDGHFIKQGTEVHADDHVPPEEYV